MTNQDLRIETLDDSEELYCGNCGVDYRGMTLRGLAEMVDRRGCPGCKSYLGDLRSAVRADWLRETAESLRAGTFDPATASELWQRNALRRACQGQGDGCELHKASPSQLLDQIDEGE